MKLKYVNPIFKATVDVFKMMLDIDAKKADAYSAQDIANTTIHVVVDITGDLSGTISYAFPEKMPSDMVAIMCGMQMDAFDSFVESALMEMANIISGKAAVYLSADKYNCDISTPRLSLGRQMIDEQNSALVIPLSTPIGTMGITIMLKEAIIL